MKMFVTLVMTGCLAVAFVVAQSRSAADVYQEGLHLEEVKGDLQNAIKTYQTVLEKFSTSREVTAKALLRIGMCYEKLGNPEAAKAYERVTRDYADQTSIVAEARSRLTALGDRPVQSRETGIVARQLWENNGIDGRPSPDGRYIPWINYPGGHGLVLHDLVTGADREITRGTPITVPEVPFFTSDGKQILYSWYDRAPNEIQLRSIRVDGTDERTLVRDFGIFGPGAVSPDGRVAAVVTRKAGSYQLALVGLASGAVTVLKSVEWRNPEIGNFSPDGRFIVYSLLVRQDSPDREVYAIAVDGAFESKLVAAPSTNRGPFFSPDGKHVVFTSNRSGGRWDLWSVRVTAGKADEGPQLIKTDIGSVTGLGFSNDGTFHYRERLDQRDAYEIEIDPATWTAKGAPSRISDRFINASMSPRWSPDGSLLTYVALPGHTSVYDATDMTFVIRRAGSADERDLRVPMTAGEAGTFPNSIQWFPDLKSLLLTRYGNPGRRFLRLDLTTGRVQTLFEAPQSTLSTIVGSGGRAVLFPQTDALDRLTKHVMRRDLETGDERSLIKAHTGGDGPAGFHGLSMSPDDRSIAYIHGDSHSLWVARLDGGEPHLVWQTDRHILAYATTWDREGRGVLVSVADSQYAESQQIWYVPVNGGQPHPVGVSMPLVTVSSVHPDGRRLGFTGGVSTRQLWTLRNLFRDTRAAR